MEVIFTLLEGNFKDQDTICHFFSSEVTTSTMRDGRYTISLGPGVERHGAGPQGTCEGP